MTDNPIQNIAEQFAKHKGEILDKFIELYIASRWEEYFKEDPTRLKRIILVEQKTKDPLVTEYFFRVKPGVLPNSNK